MPKSFDIDTDLIRKLADLLEETGLGEIEYESAGARVRVARPGSPATIASPAPPPAAALPVTAPMVGTVYLSPAPGEPPLVRVGDTVSVGQPLMLIEAMKTFNEVKAPLAGKLARIAVESGQPVEYGEVLAVIE
jgi:acetyl-CoA carboxylase biotin carboxyl carrier protein